ncbi:MAG TPA: ABC transporter ATP-binding protein [Solirubrobacteraceae bacterium]|nr:ABC transporter ATP-binding protein [Solirubrobacteraceae bacterium]
MADGPVSDGPLLEIRTLSCSIKTFQILHSVELQAREGQTTVILGRNGAGKTTTLRSVMGFVTQLEGSIRFRGDELIGRRTHEIARRGLSYVPENRGIFPDLTVEENLMVSAPRGPIWDSTLDLFPVIRERLGSKAGQLSGGQQQMLSVSRALLREPTLLILDEPSKGLAPMIIDELIEKLRSLQSHTSILLVEQNLKLARALGQHFVMLDDGYTVASGTLEELEKEGAAERFLTLTGMERGRP